MRRFALCGCCVLFIRSLVKTFGGVFLRTFSWGHRLYPFILAPVVHRVDAGARPHQNCGAGHAKGTQASKHQHLDGRMSFIKALTLCFRWRTMPLRVMFFNLLIALIAGFITMFASLRMTSCSHLLNPQLSTCRGIFSLTHLFLLSFSRGNRVPMCIWQRVDPLESGEQCPCCKDQCTSHGDNDVCDQIRLFFACIQRFNERRSEVLYRLVRSRQHILLPCPRLLATHFLP